MTAWLTPSKESGLAGRTAGETVRKSWRWGHWPRLVQASTTSTITWPWGLKEGCVQAEPRRNEAALYLENSL